jgi:glutamine amidotransferase
MKRVAIIDYGSGNLHSAAKAFERAGAGIAEIIVTSDPAALKSASHIVLPGVGAFGDCKSGLEKVSGMIAALETEVLKNKKPFFGICVGMQLLATTGLEHGEHKGLGWIKGVVKKLEVTGLKIPHMGWNNLQAKSHPVLKGLDGKDVYFVHSYHLVPQEEVVIGEVDYGGKVVAAIAKGNIFGTQFHPEKSQAAGLQLIKNFLEWQA